MTTPLETLLWKSEIVAVARADGSGRVRTANAAMERLAGNRLAGRQAGDLVVQGQRAAFLSLLASAGESPSSLRVGVAPDEHGVPRDYRASVLRDDLGVLLILEPESPDVAVLNTELVDMNEELLRMEREVRRRRDELAGQNERLRELDRLKDEFVSLVSHEFQTPLTSIHGYVGLLLEDADQWGAKQAEFLRVVERNVERLIRLVNDLLFVAHLDAGRLELDAAPIDVGEVVAECVEALLPHAADKQLEVSTRLGDVPPVTADRRRLGQLVDNLLTNAVKFTPAGGRIDVDVDRRGPYVAVDVRDTGIGIPAQDQPLVFDRFFRASAASRRAIAGSGLGLAVAKSIADAHGATIAVESAEGAGTTFRLQLPQSSER